MRWKDADLGRAVIVHSRSAAVFGRCPGLTFISVRGDNNTLFNINVTEEAILFRLTYPSFYFF
jgi:hypothetical protein